MYSLNLNLNLSKQNMYVTLIDAIILIDMVIYIFLY